MALPNCPATPPPTRSPPARSEPGSRPTPATCGWTNPNPTSRPQPSTQPNPPSESTDPPLTCPHKGPAGLRARAPVRVRPHAARAQLEGTELLPAVVRGALPAHRRLVRRAGPQRHRLGPHRDPPPGLDAGGAVDPGGQDLLGDPAAPTVHLLAAQQLLQGVPRGRPRDQDIPAAAFPVRPAA